jgi:citrate synthase
MKSVLNSQDIHVEPGVKSHSYRDRDYVDAQQATQWLGIRLATLYAYVSRGLIRSMSIAGQRQRLYLREDLERLRTKAQARSGQSAIAASALNLGQPIIPTQITEITLEGPSYRGKLAIDLVKQEASFEQVSELLWTGMWHAQPFCWKAYPEPWVLKRLTDRLPEGAIQHQMVEIFASVVMHLALGRGAIEKRLVSGSLLQAAREILLALAGCMGLLGPQKKYVHARSGIGFAEVVLQALGAPLCAENTRTMNAILVLMADHELSPGTLSARVAASSGASVHSCVAAAMSVSSGTEVALIYNSIGQFVKKGSSVSALLAKAQELVESGQRVPGFGHPLYPNGDPRAQSLLALIKTRGRLTGRASKLVALSDFMTQRYALHPRHECSLVALCDSMVIHESAAPALFALGRVAGWVAHVQEQRLSTTLIRPRAKFTLAGITGAPEL